MMLSYDGLVRIYHLNLVTSETEDALGTLRRWWDTTFAVELLLLAVAAPILYFPDRFESAEIAFAIGLLGLGWIWRRLMIGVWYQRTPADWAIFFLFFMMLPVSLWAAPGPLREQYSIPRALILIWNFFLFWTIVSHAGRRKELTLLALAGFGGAAALIAGLAPLGIAWLYKLPVLDAVVGYIPSPLVGAFQGAESGFHPNQVAGTLLYAAPLFIALGFVALFQRINWLLRIALVLLAGLLGGVLLLTQSRGGLLGLGVGTIAMLLLGRRWGRWLLLAGFVALLAALPLLPTDQLLEIFADAPPAEALGGTGTLGFRQEVWTAAIYGIQDFAFTGMGLNTFREIMFLLYPTSVNPTFNLGHAHNFFLQSALDFGLPGLVLLFALYIGAAASLVMLWRNPQRDLGFPVFSSKLLAIGLAGCLIAQSIYSLFDAVSFGAKTHFFFWYLFALIFAISQFRWTRDEPLR